MNTPQLGVLCAGLYSSASTWAFNVIADLLRGSGRARLITIYADDLSNNVAKFIEPSECFVIKSHMPGASIRALQADTMLPAVITIRDPCDAVTSLMLRFGQDFEGALNAVSRSAANLLALQHQSKPMVLRYECGFTASDAAIAGIAAYLGIVVDKGQIDQLLRRFASSAVRDRIANLLSKGVLSGKNPLLEWEEGTHWHPFHVGDGRIGKSKDVLSARQIDATIRATSAFCTFYGYPANPRVSQRLPAATTLHQQAVIGWVDDFVPPNLVFGWIVNSCHEPPVEIIAELGSQQVGKTVADLNRSDLAQLSGETRGFRLKLERLITPAELVKEIKFRVFHGDNNLGSIQVAKKLVQRTAGINAKVIKYNGC